MNSRLSIFFAGISIVLSILLLKSCQESKEAWIINAGTQDSLKITVNKLGQETAKVTVLMGEKKDLLRLNASKDSSLAKLQKLVEKQRNIISATVFSTTTNNIGASGSNIGTSDTIRVDSLIYLYPEYKTSYSDRWRSLTISANKDSVQWNVVDYNEFHLVQRFERQGLFKPKKAIIQVTNLNPYTQTRELKSFTVRPANKGTAFFAGTAVGAALIIALSFIL